MIPRPETAYEFTHWLCSDASGAFQRSLFNHNHQYQQNTKLSWFWVLNPAFLNTLFKLLLKNCTTKETIRKPICIIMLSKTTQMTKDKYHIFFYLWYLLYRENIKMEWMSHLLVYSYKCRFTESYHVNSNTLSFPKLKRK